MMADQKGRSGKKPKYQIADIGGTDLTSQDISTERVLNFLIKGELDSAADQALHVEGEALAAAKTHQEQTTTDNFVKPVETPLPSPETQGKKSLAHLFQRAGGGGDGRTVKNLKLDLGTKEQTAETASAPQMAKHKQLQSVTAHSGAERQEQPVQRLVTSEVTSVTSSSPTAPLDAPPQPIQISAVVATGRVTPSFQESANLDQITILWKSFYRLNAGEIDAMTALYHMSYGDGSSECYIKMRNLAEMSNLTYRYCQKIVRRLEQLGWLTKIRDYDASTQLGVLYRVNLKPVI
jgi:hypothetical protein